MGASVRGGGLRSTPTTVAEINIVPLVDIMLVLLVVFMISAPLMQQGVQVNLPRANAGSLDEVPDQLVLVVDRSRAITINKTAIAKGTLRARLGAIATAKPDVQVFIQADETIPYGFIAQVMAEVKQSGIQRVGLVTQPGDAEQRL